MSYWYEAKKENIKLNGDEIDIWLDDKPVYEDCGNVYVSIKVKDLLELIKNK